MKIDIKKFDDHTEVSTSDVSYVFAPYNGLTSTSKESTTLEEFLERLFVTAKHDDSIIIKVE